MKPGAQSVVRCALFLLTAHCALLAVPAFAAKVILKDGKIIEGKIIAETEGDVLIKTSPVSRSRLIPSDRILSVVRDPAEVKVRDPQRYVELEGGLTGSAFSSSDFSLDPAVGIRIGGGMRFHPLMQIDTVFEWQPAMSGSFSATDGVTTRSYERFLGYGGGFSGRLFPFYRKSSQWKAEPFFVLGYEWHQLRPKGTEDVLKGGGFHTGFGGSWAVGKNLFFNTTFLYHRIQYGRMFFLLRDGDIDPTITLNTYSLMTSLAWRL